MTAKTTTLMLLSFLFASLGCRANLNPKYGESEDYESRCSPAGLSVFRSLAERKSRETLTVRTLTPTNMKRLKTIVWCPDSMGGHSDDTNKWMSNWLRTGDKTLIYIGRDFSPHEQYWIELAERSRAGTGQLTTVQNAMENAAIEHETLQSLRRANRPEVVTPWFTWDFQPTQMEHIQEWTGEWSQRLQSHTTSIHLRSTFRSLSDENIDRLKRDFESLNEVKTPTTAPVKPDVEYVPTSTSSDIAISNTIKRIDSERLATDTQLLATTDGRSVISRFRSDEWPNSKLYVIANNSILSNLGMLRSGNRQLALSLLEDSKPGSIGFVSGKFDPRVVKNGEEASEKQKGFEMFTVWPLNIMTIHAAFLGFVAMIAAFPIFGRPQQLPRRSTTDFGQHIEAVGELMQRSQDRFYAKQTISDYFRLVRKDLASPWISVAPAVTEKTSPFKEQSNSTIQGQ